MVSLKTRFLNSVNTIRRDPAFKSLRGIFLFVTITVLIHVLYRFWANTLNYYPIREFFTAATFFMEDVVLHQSSWIIVNVLQIPTFILGNVMWFSAKWGIAITEGCTGIKQIIQVLLLFLIYPGPWKHKAWFIPSGIIIIHITNVIRITLLAIAMKLNFPEIHFIHSYPLRLFFYVVIFGLWWIWEEKISHGGKNKPGQKPI
jgi:exosortase/archaeosortase family protein